MAYLILLTSRLWLVQLIWPIQKISSFWRIYRKPYWQHILLKLILQTETNAKTKTKIKTETKTETETKTKTETENETKNETDLPDFPVSSFWHWRVYCKEEFQEFSDVSLCCCCCCCRRCRRCYCCCRGCFSTGSTTIGRDNRSRWDFRREKDFLDLEPPNPPSGTTSVRCVQGSKSPTRSCPQTRLEIKLFNKK